MTESPDAQVTTSAEALLAAGILAAHRLRVEDLDDNGITNWLG